MKTLEDDFFFCHFYNIPDNFFIFKKKKFHLNSNKKCNDDNILFQRELGIYSYRNDHCILLYNLKGHSVKNTFG